MKKRELKKMKPLYSTAEMVRQAKADKAVVKKYYYSTQKEYLHDKYFRCCVEQGILKVAVFLVEDLKKSAKLPVYEIYFDKNNMDFITFDTISGKWRNAMLNALEMEKDVTGKTPYIEKKDDDKLRRYFSSEKSAEKAMQEFQYKVRDLQLKAKHKKETDPWDEFLNRTPDIPDTWEQDADLAMKQQYIFYRYERNGAKTGYCTVCKKEVPIVIPKHNKETTCKCCGRHVQFKSIGKFKQVVTENENAYLVQKAGDGFVIRYFTCWRKHTQEDYKHPEIHCFEGRRTFYDGNANPIDAYYYGDYKHECIRWIKTCITSNTSYGMYNDYKGHVKVQETDDLMDCLKQTGIIEMSNTGCYYDPEIFLNAVKKYPVIEKFAKAGLKKIAEECLHRGTMNRFIVYDNTKELTKMLGIDKMRLARLKSNNGSSHFLSWLQYEKRLNTQLDDGIYKWFEAASLYPKDLKEMLSYMSVTKAMNFIKRQLELGFASVGTVIRTYDDYINMALRLKFNLKKEIFNRPKNLVTAHNEVIEMCDNVDTVKRAGQIINTYPDIDTICQSIKDKYEFENEQFSIVVPEKVEDIINEGKILRHCVGSSDIYFERIQNRETYIVFLRHTKEVDKPYYTLEIEPNGTIRQKRTTGDRQNEDIEEADKFLRIWQKAIHDRLTKEDVELAQVSKSLRKKEFVELRKSKTKIRNGVLAGKLLVDVLEEDLMEIEEELHTCA